MGRHHSITRHLRLTEAVQWLCRGCCRQANQDDRDDRVLDSLHGVKLPQRNPEAKTTMPAERQRRQLHGLPAGHHELHDNHRVEGYMAKRASPSRAVTVFPMKPGAHAQSLSARAIKTTSNAWVRQVDRDAHEHHDAGSRPSGRRAKNACALINRG